jgi:hypothetical protein
MKGFWGFMKGSLALQVKAMPRLFLSPLIGAVRGAWATSSEEWDKCEAEITAFQERYMKEREAEMAQMSQRSTTAGVSGS